MSSTFSVIKNNSFVCLDVCFNPPLSFERDKVYCSGWPPSVWHWYTFEENLWDLFRLCTQEPVLFPGNANQVLTANHMLLCLCNCLDRVCWCWALNIWFPGVNCLTRIWRVHWKLRRRLETSVLDLEDGKNWWQMETWQIHWSHAAATQTQLEIFQGLFLQVESDCIQSQCK